ncbi:MAG: BatA domain-containing protein [Steroidobacteraceae bacterium]
MNWLSPWFLLGALGIGLPLWLHRLQTKNPERRPFASTMLLESAERRLLVQKRLRFWALLIARIALLLLLALCFAKPEWRLPAGAPGTQSAALQLVIVDTSLSMQAAGVFERARNEAQQSIDALPPGMKARLISAGGVVEALGDTATADKSLLRSELQQLAPGAGRLDMAQLMNALDGLAGDERGLIRVALFSDFQQSALPVQFALLLPRASAGRRFELELHPAVSGDPRANWRIASIAQKNTDIEVSVAGAHTPARTLGVTLLVNDKPVATQNVVMPAEGGATARFAAVRLSGEDSRVTARIEAQDALAADDVRYAVVQNLRADPVPLLTADVAGAAARYLDAAYRAAGDRYRIEPHSAQGFDTRTLGRYRWLIVDDLGALDAPLAQALQSYVSSGGAVFAALGPRSAALTKAPLAGDALSWSAARRDEPLQIGAVDASHPLLVRTAGWQAASIARLAGLQPQAADKVLLATNDGAPLLIERRIGAGRLLLLTSSLDNDWNDLPLQAVFVGFTAELADYLSERGADDRELIAGTTLRLGAGSGAAQVLDPEGREMLGLAQTRGNARVLLARAGFYQVSSAERQRLLAVNPDARESDLATLPAAQLAQWRDAAVAGAVAEAMPAGVQAAPTLPIWRTLLAIFVLVVLVESALGMLHLRRTVRAT